jgi:hypothetical protein
MNYVLMKDGKYVARSGSKYAFTSKLERARTFRDREEADANRCNDEAIVHISSLIR